MFNEKFESYMKEINNITAELKITDYIFVVQLYTILVKYYRKRGH